MLRVLRSSPALRQYASHEIVAARGGWQSPRKIDAPPMVYISGEEMTRYTMQLILDQWVRPHIQTDNWQFFDLSCVARDATNDQVLRDAVKAGAECRAIFKEPTITPSAVQTKALGLSKPLPSPNGAMRRGWNGITISRDTIHIEGVQLGFARPVFFERHAVGGEYQAGWKAVGRGRLLTTFFPDDPQQPPIIVDARHLTDDKNVAVTYHNPLDNVADLAHHFFSRCLAAGIVPYVVTKKTVFKWQEPFWQIHKDVFDNHYKADFKASGLLDKCGGELQHLISDAASMLILRWRDGGFGMSAHNYDGDMLTDEISQVHRSPGFITSNLIGRTADGTPIKEFEASHGTVADMWEAHQRGEETSLNPLGMATALIGAIRFSGEVAGGKVSTQLAQYCDALEKALHNTFRYGQGTRDMAGDRGLTTENFVGKVAWRLGRYIARNIDADPERPLPESYTPQPAGAKALEALYDQMRTSGVLADDVSFDDFQKTVTAAGGIAVAPDIRTSAMDKVGVTPPQ